MPELDNLSAKTALNLPLLLILVICNKKTQRSDKLGQLRNQILKTLYLSKNDFLALDSVRARNINNFSALILSCVHELRVVGFGPGLGNFGDRKKVTNLIPKNSSHFTDYNGK